MLRVVPLFLSVAPETCETIKHVLAWLRKEVDELKDLVWEGKTFTFTFKLLTGDHSFLQKALGNSGGSAEYRCEYCDASFRDLTSLWDYAKLHSRNRKMPISIASSSGVLPGLTRLSPLFAPANQPEWIQSFVIGVDPLHTLGGHLKQILARLQTWSLKRNGTWWDDAKFSTAFREIIKRQHISDCDGAHLRLLVANWSSIILPALTDKCPFSVKENLRCLFNEWTEIQWILYADPELRQYVGIRLRLHVLLLSHLYFCRKLFPDRRTPKKKTLTNTNALTVFATFQAMDLKKKELVAVLPDICAHFGVNLMETAATTFKRDWPKLRVEQMRQLYRSMKNEHAIDLPHEERSSHENKDTVMKLYGHVLVSHTADFYELMDFKNASAERGEFFFAQGKKILKNMTSRDLTKEEPFAQIFIRLGFAAQKRLKNGGKTIISSCNRRIRTAFKEHAFEELTISLFMFSPAEIDAFLKNLQHWGYKENTHWTRNEEGVISFQTLEIVHEKFNSIYS